MKLNKISAILIWSEDYESLEVINHPDDTGVGLSVGDSYLWIGKHSEIHGKNKDPL